MSADNRAHPRAALELQVVYQRLNAFIADYTHNLSKGGTFIKTTIALPMGTELEFQLSIPKRDEPFRLRGKVVWIVRPQDAADAAPPGMGLSFLWPDAAAQTDFENAVDAVITNALGANVVERMKEKRES